MSSGLLRSHNPSLFSPVVCEWRPEAEKRAGIVLLLPCFRGGRVFWDRWGESDTSVFQSPGSGLWCMWETWQTSSELNPNVACWLLTFCSGGSNFRHEYSRMGLCFMYVKRMLRAFMLVPRDTLGPLILQNSVLLRFHGFPAELWPLGPRLGCSPSPANTSFLL